MSTGESVASSTMSVNEIFKLGANGLIVGLGSVFIVLIIIILIIEIMKLLNRK